MTLEDPKSIMMQYFLSISSHCDINAPIKYKVINAIIPNPSVSSY